MIKRRKFIQTLMVATILPLTACQKQNNYQRLPKDSLVVALGDSLTFGYGASKNNDYPSILAQKTGWRIVNAGVNGDTTADVLKRLPDVLSQNPKLVLLSIGGNDVLKRVPKNTTENNLMAIIRKIQQQNIDVVLIAEPHLSMSNFLGKASDNPVYKKVAKASDVPLLSDAWSKILSDETLKSDQIHANDLGYQKFAQFLYDYLDKIGYV